MNSAPTELLYVLLVAAVLLVQYLLKRFGPQPEEAPTPVVDEQAGEPRAPDLGGGARTPELAADSLAAPPSAARHEAPVAGTPMPQRRSGVRALPNGGPDLRRVIVGMTLLGPCRAQEPHESR